MKKSYTLAEVLEAIKNVDKIITEIERQEQKQDDFKI